MRENVGHVDAVARTMIGGALIYASIHELGLARARHAVLAALGVVLVETAITRVCPLNALLGIDTRGSAPALERPGSQALGNTPTVRGLDARSPTVVHSERMVNAADLDPPYDDAAGAQRPPSDS